MLSTLKKVIPEPIVALFRAPYHYLLQWWAACEADFPARTMTLIGVGGTKGKSTVSEMVHAILSDAGLKTALVGTIRFAIGDQSEPNIFKMTMPGHGFIQRFLRKAKNAGATHAIIELTTEGARQYRHLFLYPDIMVMTNVQKEHIESHGSFEKYVAKKWGIVREIEHSPKPKRTMIASVDDQWNAKFVTANVPHVVPYSIRDIHNAVTTDSTASFTYKNVLVTVPIAGLFNAVNALAALKVAEALDIPLTKAAHALHTMPVVRGRVEHIDEGQNFIAIVDYAHTPDSLQALYDAFPTHKKICVLGNTGGGRDTWKRPAMGAIADTMCTEVILTNEDPYGEDPQSIVVAMAQGMKRAPTIIMDRRKAIQEALTRAKDGYVVLISGKGTDPYIMGPHGSKEVWSDAQVVREELTTLLTKKGTLES